MTGAYLRAPPRATPTCGSCGSARECTPQLRNRRGERPHPKARPGLVVVLGQDARVLVDLPDEPLLGVGDDQLLVDHRSLEKIDDRLAKRADIGRVVRGEDDDVLPVALSQGVSRLIVEAVGF